METRRGEQKNKGKNITGPNKPLPYNKFNYAHGHTHDRALIAGRPYAAHTPKKKTEMTHVVIRMTEL